MPRILVTNDDGVSSEGIHALADAMRSLGDVVVVAPLQEASAIGHALTLRRPLRIEEVRPGVYAVDGTPTDCVNIGVEILMKDEPPVLVVSGINKGWNLGDDVTYSGTVSGALEGALLGLPAIAVSQKRTPVFDFGAAADAAAVVARAVLEKGLSPRTFVSINMPEGAPKGFRITSQAKRNHVTKIDTRVDPRGNAYYWIEEGLDDWHPNGGTTDYEAVKSGYISVTPLQPDMTAYDALGTLAGFDLR